jgi:hypothetical protein
MTNDDIVNVIEILVPNARFILIGDTLDGLDWLDERPFPSKAEFDATLKKLPALIKAQSLAKETAKAAILDRIGLTADELQTILG